MRCERAAGVRTIAAALHGLLVIQMIAGLSPKGMMFLGVGLMILGVVLPFLMILRIIEASFWVSFLSYGGSVSGLVIAFLGLIMYARREKH